MSLKQQAVRGVKWTSGATLLTTILSTLQLLVLGWLLESDDFGLMAMVMIFVGLAQACSDMGITGALIHRESSSEERSSLYWLNLLAGLLTTLVIFGCAPLAAILFDDPRVASILCVMAIASLVVPLGKQFEALLQRDMHFGILAAIEVGAGVCAFAAAIVAAASGAGVWALVVGFLTGVFVRSFVGLFVGIRRYPVHASFRFGDTTPFLTFGAFQLGDRALGFLAQRLDQILIGGFLGSSTLGFYSYAFNLVEIPTQRLNLVVAKVTFPLLARVQDEREKLRSGFLRVFGFLAAINGPFLIGVAVTAPIAVPLILGEKWREAVPYLMVLSLVVLAKSPGSTIGALLLAKGKAQLSFFLSLTVFLITVPAICIGAYLGQGIGVALALLVVQVVIKFPLYRWLIRPLVGECAGPFAWALLKPMVLAVCMGLCILAVTPWTGLLPPVADLTLQVLIGAVVYLALMVMLDRARVRELISLLLHPRGGSEPLAGAIRTRA